MKARRPVKPTDSFVRINLRRPQDFSHRHNQEPQARVLHRKAGPTGGRNDRRQRADVAYIAARLIGESCGVGIYDATLHKHILITGTIAQGVVNVYDHHRQARLCGMNDFLYDSGANSLLHLRVLGECFSGFDYDSAKYFSGRVSGSSVWLYDFETARHHHYWV